MKTIELKTAKNGALITKTYDCYSSSRKFDDAVAALTETTFDFDSKSPVQIMVERNDGSLICDFYTGGFNFDERKYIFTDKAGNEYSFWDNKLALKHFAKGIFGEVITVKTANTEVNVDDYAVSTEAQDAAVDAEIEAANAPEVTLNQLHDEYVAAFIAKGKALDQVDALIAKYGKDNSLDTYKKLGEAEKVYCEAAERLNKINAQFDAAQARAIRKQADFLADKIARDAQPSDDDVFSLIPATDELNDIESDLEAEEALAAAIAKLLADKQIEIAEDIFNKIIANRQESLTDNMKTAAQIVGSLGNLLVKFDHRGEGKNGGLAIHYETFSDEHAEFPTSLRIVEVFTDMNSYILHHVNVITGYGDDKQVTQYFFNTNTATNYQAEFYADKIARDAQPSDDEVWNLITDMEEDNDTDDELIDPPATLRDKFWQAKRLVWFKRSIENNAKFWYYDRFRGLDNVCMGKRISKARANEIIAPYGITADKFVIEQDKVDEERRQANTRKYNRRNRGWILRNRIEGESVSLADSTNDLDDVFSLIPSVDELNDVEDEPSFEELLAADIAEFEAAQPAEVKELNTQLAKSDLQAPTMWVKIMDGAGQHRGSFSKGVLNAVRVEYNAEPEAIKGYTLHYFNNEPMGLYDTLDQVKAVIEKFKVAIVNNAESFTFPKADELNVVSLESTELEIKLARLYRNKQLLTKAEFEQVERKLLAAINGEDDEPTDPPIDITTEQTADSIMSAMAIAYPFIKDQNVIENVTTENFINAANSDGLNLNIFMENGEHKAVSVTKGDEKLAVIKIEPKPRIENPKQLRDSLERAMKVALENRRAARRNRNLALENYEYELYTICKNALKEVA